MYRLDNKLIGVLNNEGFSVAQDNDRAEFQVYSSSCQEYHIIVNKGEDLNDLINSTIDLYYDYDPHYDALLRIGPDEYGSDDIMYDVFDIYNDMAEFQDQIFRLVKILTVFSEKN